MTMCGHLTLSRGYVGGGQERRRGTPVHLGEGKDDQGSENVALSCQHLQDEGSEASSCNHYGGRCDENAIHRPLGVPLPSPLCIIWSKRRGS